MRKEEEAVSKSRVEWELAKWTYPQMGSSVGLHDFSEIFDEQVETGGMMGRAGG
jgi:hypothetical protein